MKSFVADDPNRLIEQAPPEAGVYLMKDESGSTIYVGKSSNLRKRIRSHLAGAGKGTPVARVSDIEYVVTGSDLDALILECNLIKRLRPTFNARLKDDKTYPYIKVTVQEEFPGVYVSRLVRDDGSIYMGPYADVGSARKTIKVLRRIFPIRTCRRRLDRPSRPCLDYHIKRCSGPCTGNVDPKSYRADVEGLLTALEGNKTKILEEIRDAMFEASRAMNYERAAALRDKLQALERTTIHQRLSNPGPGNADVLGLAQGKDYACVQILYLRDRAIIDQEHFLLESAREGRGDLLTSFVKEYYSNNPVPAEILLSVAIPEARLIERWFRSRSGRDVQVREPESRDERRLVEMADRNARLMLEFERRTMGESLKLGLQDLARALDMVRLPRVIEAFDLSNTSGKGPVGSMVRFRWGRPNRSMYRRFRIREAPGRDDFAMMREVVRRRFKEAVAREETLPDLVLVDGGPGQASAAGETLREMGLTIPVVGLAKREEDLYRPGSYEAVSLRKGSPGHMLLRRIRDEAHRFAITYHRSLRGRAMTRSSLDSVRGVGPRRKAALLRAFGSVDKIRRSTPQEIAALPGISRPLAERILDHLTGRERGRVD